MTSAKLHPTGPQNATIISSLRLPSMRSLMLRVPVAESDLAGALAGAGAAAGADIL